MDDHDKDMAWHRGTVATAVYCAEAALLAGFLVSVVVTGSAALAAAFVLMSFAMMMLPIGRNRYPAWYPSNEEVLEWSIEHDVDEGTARLRLERERRQAMHNTHFDMWFTPT